MKLTFRQRHVRTIFSVLVVMLLLAPLSVSAQAANLTPLVAEDLGSWYQARSGYAPNPDWFGVYAIEPHGDQLYLGFGTARPAEADGALVASWHGRALTAVHVLPEQGFIDMALTNGILDIPGPDPLADWSLGNIYRHTPGGATQQLRTLPQTIHTWGLWREPRGNMLYTAVARHLGGDQYGAGIYMSSDNGQSWTLDANPNLGVWRTYDVLGATSGLFAVAGTTGVTCKLAVKPNVTNARLASSASWSQYATSVNCRTRLQTDLSGEGVIALESSGRLLFYGHGRSRSLRSVGLPFQVDLYQYNYLAKSRTAYYLLDKAGGVWQTGDMRSFTKLTDLGRPGLALAYWPARNALVISTRGAGASLYLYQL